jgi:hypothetical protein
MSSQLLLDAAPADPSAPKTVKQSDYSSAAPKSGEVLKAERGYRLPS